MCIRDSFLPFRKACIFRRLFEKPLGPSWDRLGTVLGRSWEGFGSQNRCQHRPWRKCQNCIFASTRIKKSRFERIEKESKINVKTTCQACSQEVPKNAPKVSQNGPKRVPRGLQKEVKNWLQLKKLKKMSPKSGPRGMLKTTSKKTPKKAPKKNVLASEREAR